MLYTFIWKSSVNRVKKDIMQKEYQEGGFKMINIHSFILALKYRTVGLSDCRIIATAPFIQPNCIGKKVCPIFVFVFFNNRFPSI
jgi:hypothetical protein